MAQGKSKNSSGRPRSNSSKVVPANDIVLVIRPPWVQARIIIAGT
jgi:hypothetical protein